MRTYKIRVLLDADQDVFRDIEVSEEHTFLQLHKTILKSFGFKGDQMASFYVSNEDWDKGEEIPLMDMDGMGLDMAATTIGDMVEDEGQKFVYVYDFLRMWCFYLDFVEETKTGKLDAPAVLLKFGVAPKETSKEIADIRSDSFGDSDSDEEPDESEFDDVLEGGDDYEDEPYESNEGSDDYY